MKTFFIFLLYFLTIISIAGFATFLMYHHIDGWGWLIFIEFLVLTINVKVRE